MATSKPPSEAPPGTLQADGLTGADSASMFWTSESYIRAAERIAPWSIPPEKDDLLIPFNMLIGFSAELAFKSVLSEHGWSTKRLQAEVGHSLNAGYASAKSCGLTSSKAAALDRFVENMESWHGWRYPLRYLPSNMEWGAMPAPEDSVTIMRRLQRDIAVQYPAIVIKAKARVKDPRPSVFTLTAPTLP